MRITAAILGTALAAVFISPSSAASVRITRDPGGQIGPYLEKFESIRDSGQKVMVDGPCLSACTLVLGVVPHNRLCVTSRARFGFHAAWRPDEVGHRVVSQEGVEFLMSIYPHQVRDWILRRGGLSANMMYLSGGELASMYPTCPEGDNNVAARRDVGPARGLSQPLTSTFALRRKTGRRPADR